LQATLSLEFFTDWMLFLTPNQQRQSAEGEEKVIIYEKYKINTRSNVASRPDTVL